MLLDEGGHLGLGEGVDGLVEGDALLLAEALDELVGAEALLALLAVHQRIGEAAQMAGGHPGLGIHQDGGVEADVVGVLLDEFLPPGALDVVLELHAQGAVVPGVGQAAVDFGAGEDEAAALAQRDDLIHGLLGIFQHLRFLQTSCFFRVTHYTESRPKNQQKLILCRLKREKSTKKSGAPGAPFGGAVSAIGAD